MQLYHYSTKKHSTLKTLLNQGKVTVEDKLKAERDAIKHKTLFGVFQPGYYFEHISFFFDPIPRNIYQYFPKDHKVWTKGTKLYEHVIELNEQSEPFTYEIVEFPERIELYYDRKVDDKTFFKKVGSMLKEDGYIGKGYAELSETLHRKSLVGKTTHFFERLPNRPNYKDIANKYAATVPHVMIYPLLGKIKTQEVKLITLE